MKRLVLPIGLVLAGCGGGGDSFTQPEPDATLGPATVSILLTDAPVDTVQEVNVQFTTISLRNAQGDSINLPLTQTAAVDLLRLQGGTTASLVTAVDVPAGSYTTLQIGVNAEFDSVFDSYAVRDGGQVEIRVPGQQFEISGSLDVESGISRSFVIDWDLRQSLTEPAGEPGFVLNAGVRILDVITSASLSGSVSDLLINDDLNGSASCNNDLGEDVGNAVYLYRGTVASPDDIQPADVSPLATATVSFDGTGYGYSFGFLEAGDYTAALTCQGLGDDPTTDDDIEFASVVSGITIGAGENATQDF